ncbi:phage tail protein [uncultured Acinetobacter sp.]|uniref:phage tail protein n=1 Tax=uncultured Acinetobacter sp. TaxID=165433 RepID=UPI00258EEDB8|nr:phage tail protein [uncultured Acinetobacter sp.]
MGGSSGQVAGYKYFVGLMVVIGNTIEKLININPDNRGWILNNAPDGDGSVFVNKPDLFGGDKQEGGWVGYIDVHTGRPETLEPNHYLAIHDSEIVSAFPNLSYLVYHGLDDQTGFQIVSMSGIMKEVLYRVKRTRIKSDGSVQWYEKNSKGSIVCEINALDTVYQKGVSSPYNYTFKEKTIDHNGIEHIVDSTGSYVPVNLDKNIIVDTATSGLTASFSDNGGLTSELNAETTVTILSDGIMRVKIVASSVANEKIINQEIAVIKILSESDVTEKIDNNFYYTRTYTLECIAVLKAGTAIKASVKSKGAVKQFDDPILFDKNVLSANAAIEIYPLVPSDSSYDTEQVDINPLHKIREILTDDTAMNKPESDVNDENFMFAADRIWEESLGISWAIQEKSCKEAIDELLYHIEAGIRVNRQTGQYEIVLFRDDLLNLDDAMHFDESNIKEFNREVANQDDLINVLNVKYYDRETIKESSFNVYENGNLMSNGNQEITEAVNFPYFMNRRNAELVANWKLKQLSTPTWKGSFTTGKYEARKLNKYDVIKLSWVNAGFVDMPVRIMKISLGDGRDNTVSIDWVEVIPYSSLSYQSINVDPPTSVVLPAQSNVSKVFEMPYFEAVQNFGQTQVDAELANNPDLGYLMIASKRPQNNSLNALLYTNSGTGYIQQNVINYCPTLTLDQNIDYLDTSFAVKNVDSISNAELGSCLVVDNEIMVYQSFNAMTKVITVKRGALDTLPAKHNLNANAFFYDAYPNYDTTQYVDSEVINALSLTTTPSSVLKIVDATPLALEINARAIRPYPPANIKINNSYYLAESQIVNDLVITWVHRNRLQQTGGSILGWTDATVTKETGVTYSIQLLENNVVLLNQTGITTNSYTISKSVLLPNKLHKLKVWAVRDLYDSFQVFEHQIFITAPDVTLTTTLYKDHIIGTTLAAANVTTVVDESLSANMKWDGTSISGKAQPGATITIEVNT